VVVLVTGAATETNYVVPIIVPLSAAMQMGNAADKLNFLKLLLRHIAKQDGMDLRVSTLVLRFVLCPVVRLMVTASGMIKATLLLRHIAKLAGMEAPVSTHAPRTVLSRAAPLGVIATPMRKSLSLLRHHIAKQDGTEAPVSTLAPRVVQCQVALLLGIALDMTN